jgi:PAS domain S-box-containing protein
VYLDKYQTLSEDGERVLCRAWRVHDDGTRRSVLVVLLAAEYPSLSSFDRLTHEYELKDELEEAWAARPLELVRDGDRAMLVLEDPGGDPLDRLAGRPLETGQFLRIAISLVGALWRTHERGLIHKDVKPANVLVDLATGQAWLTGFAIASRLAREYRPSEPPQVIAGTLAYMAPEQTGRMNRSVDSRSDLYALGVTFYELLTGSLPFTASDPIELIHRHLAREPIPPRDRVETVPAQLSAMVTKLLAKTAEERYQTAAGVEADLRKCLAAWDATGRIDEFPLGAQDAADRLIIPERLYGREREIAKLLEAFDRVVTHGRSELVLVTGYSGIGKSSLINELHKAIVLPRGIFISGKFDLRLKDIPYSTLAQAFHGLIRQILSGEEEDISRWCDAIREAVGNHAGLLTDLIPELGRLIGPQAPAAVLSPAEASLRFQLVFQRFVSVFARPEHPLVIFVDDLQWLDPATLTLVQYLITHRETRHLLLIGAYRDNEVGSEHPLALALASIRQTDTPMSELRLGPLSTEDVNRLLCDAFRCEPADVRPLALLLHRQTGGNAFFTVQLLTSLAEERLLTFDWHNRAWTWDVERIAGKGAADNLLDLMIGRLRRLPDATQEALKLLACLGSQGDFSTLTIVYSGSGDGATSTIDVVSESGKMHASFRAAVEAGAIISQEGKYRFLHDRAQEAAYALIPAESRARLHLRVGRLLASGLVPKKIAERIFDIVNQLNQASSLISDWAEKQRVAELNLQAGRKAKASSAYVSACHYLAAAMDTLADEMWQNCYDLTLELYLERAECEILSSKLDLAAALIEELLRKCRSKTDRAEACRLRMLLELRRGDYAPAVRTALECLRTFKLELPERPTPEQLRAEYDEVRRTLGARSIASLVDLPLMADAEMRAVMKLLNSLGEVAYHSDSELFQMVTCSMVKLTLRHGTTEFSTIAYASLGIVLGPVFHLYREGEAFGRLAVAVSERHGFTAPKAGAHFLMQMAVLWTRPIDDALICLEAAARSARETGEMVYACYTRQHRLTDLIARGDPLDEAWRESMAALDFVRKYKFGQLVILSIQDFVQGLRGQARGVDRIDGAALEARVLRSGVAVVACFHWILQLRRCFLLGDSGAALGFAAKAEPLLWSARHNIQSVDYCFYHSLALAAVFPAARPERQTTLREVLGEHLHSLERWAASCPKTFSHKHTLIAAEAARIDGREFEAMRLYEQTIRFASANGFVHEEAIGYEVASKFYAANGFDKIAEAYLLQARSCYVRWGAGAKVRQLDQQYPGLQQERFLANTTSMIAMPVENLDLATVIKVSQSVSGELVLTKLIDRLMRAAIEHAGAQRGLLINPQNDGLAIEAEATTRGADLVVNLDGITNTAGALPEALVKYVARTQETVILDNALSKNPFSADPYIAERQARSVLCLPLITQGKFIGILYLENNLAPSVFTAGRVAVLKVLASQAAISLENTRLYRDLAEREAKIRRLIDSNIIGIFFWNFDGRILDANDAFLRMVKYDREDLVAGRMRWTEMTPPEWRDRNNLRIETHKSSGHFPPFEKEYTRKDGIRVPVLMGEATFEEGGHEGVAYVLDLTERKRAEEALRDSEQALRRSEAWLTQAQRLSHTGFWVYNAATTLYFYWSDESYRIWGFDPLQGPPSRESMWQRIHPGDRDEVRREVQEALRQKRDFAAEFRILLPDGTVKYLEATTRHVFSESGVLVEAVSTHVDVTERKRAQQEHERLRQLETDIAHMNRVSMMGELTASLAHEIKQPIAAGRNNARAALNFLDAHPPDLGEVTEALDCVVGDVDRAAQIIDRIRDQIKKAPQQKDRFDINEAITDVIVLARGETIKNGVAVETELAETVLLVEGDRVQLQQVILNLILNAVEAMRSIQEEPRKLTISSEQTMSNDVVVAVCDTGPGIDPEDIKRVFEAFYTTKSDGTGMGLSICRSIIDAHGGRLWAEVNEPRGALLRFVLPGLETNSHALFVPVDQGERRR